MRLTRSIITSCFLLLTSALSAQFLNPKDWVGAVKENKPEYFVGLNNRRAILFSQQLIIYGISAGANYNDVIKLYAGYNASFLSQSEARTKFNDLNGNRRTRITQRSLNFLGLSAEPFFYRKNKLEASMPVTLGLGAGKKITYVEGSQITTLETTKTFVMPLEIGAKATYYFFDWFGVNVGLGSRIAFGGSNAFAIYSGSYYSFGLGFYLGPVWEVLKESF